MNARLRYTVPDDRGVARHQYETDPWVNHVVKFVAERAGVSETDVVDGRHRKRYDVPLAFMSGAVNVDVDRTNDVTPPSIAVRNGGVGR